MYTHLFIFEQNSSKANVKLQYIPGLDLSPSQITSIIYESNTPKFINQISTPCQILIKERYFNLSIMLNLKKPMDVPMNTPKLERTT